MKDFKIAQPRTVDELAALLAETKAKTAIIAGGTDLLDELKNGVAAPDLLVDLKDVAGLAGIAPDKEGLRIGPMTRIVDVVDGKLNNLGTKGLGEPPRIPGSAAIANAVFNAIGVHVREIPMTPQRVLAALKRKEA